MVEGAILIVGMWILRMEKNLEGKSTEMKEDILEPMDVMEKKVKAGAMEQKEIMEILKLL